MSYIPDYRKETDKLNDVDKNFISGYRAAIEDALNFFNNLDVYETSELEEELIEKIGIKDCLKDWMGMEETEQVLALFEGEGYEDIELVDANKPLFTNTTGADNG